MKEIKLDESLTQFLVDSGFTYKRMVPLLPANSSRVWAVMPGEKVEDIITLVIERFIDKEGCIFTLPGDESDQEFPWPTYVYYTPLSPHEIRKRVALKVFL